MSKVKSVHKKEGRVWVFWTVVSTEPLSFDEAKQIQNENGYLVMGYSCNDFHSEKEGDEYVSKWTCYASCD